MDTTFNFSRFLKILSNEWRLNILKMLLFWGVMIISAVIYFAFFRVDSEIVSKSQTFMLFFPLMCILQGFYLQIYYREFSSKTKTQALLLLPASRNETFWAKFLLGIILYGILFAAFLFILIKWNGIYNEKIMTLKAFPVTDWRYGAFERYQTLEVNLMIILSVFLIYLFFVSAYLFGIMSFKKLAAFKSLALWFIIIMGLVLITCIVYALFTGVWPSIAVPGINLITERGKYGCVMINIYPEILYGLGLFICLALIFISRIKYNEKTI